MQIRPITDDELPAFIETTMREYAEQKHTMGGLTQQEAWAEAARETELLFPAGHLSSGHAVLIATDDDGRRLGRLWLAPRPGSTQIAFVYDVAVEEDARGHGHGRALMQEAARWARDRGFDAVALHVFGGNDVAIGLYRSLGYRTTDLLMKLDL